MADPNWQVITHTDAQSLTLPDLVQPADHARFQQCYTEALDTGLTAQGSWFQEMFDILTRGLRNVITLLHASLDAYEEQIRQDEAAHKAAMEAAISEIEKRDAVIVGMRASIIALQEETMAQYD